MSIAPESVSSPFLWGSMARLQVMVRCRTPGVEVFALAEVLADGMQGQFTIPDYGAVTHGLVHEGLINIDIAVDQKV